MLGLKGFEFRAEQGAPTSLLGYNTPSKTRVPCLLITIKKKKISRNLNIYLPVVETKGVLW